MITNKIKKGFSLLELMIVVAILSIMAVAIVPNLLSYVDTFKVKKVTSDMRSFKKAAELFYEKEGRWPVNFKEFIDIKDPRGAMNPWGYPYKMDKYFFYANRPDKDTNEVGYIPPVYYREYYFTISSESDTYTMKPVYIDLVPPLAPVSLGTIMANTMKDDRVNIYFVSIKGSSVIYLIIQYNSNLSGVIKTDALNDFNMYLDFYDQSRTPDGSYMLTYSSNTLTNVVNAQWRRYVFFEFNCLEDIRFKFRLDKISTVGGVPYEFGYISSKYGNFFTLTKGVEYEIKLRN
ncbi:MAG: hypothetical protein C0601_06795 [Candidatus Muiribacterium halophilum]|uniref:Type II secretion system protein GspG C-terminal domain-containing protein n=1 Tax=Muiribacterium halophilum TaxID=2053465 RepID=A0A2N5ZGI8_MUIH1|nr:MAG: hypothetical protein C0601_06795 [Candidatus Muirbacterium halophilum]